MASNRSHLTTANVRGWGGEACQTQQKCSCMLVLTAHNVVEAQAMPLDRHIHHVLKRELCWFGGATFNSAGLTVEAILLLPATSFFPGSRTHTHTHTHCIILHTLHSQNRLGIRHNAPKLLLAPVPSTHVQLLSGQSLELCGPFTRLFLAQCAGSWSLEWSNRTRGFRQRTGRSAGSCLHRPWWRKGREAR